MRVNRTRTLFKYLMFSMGIFFALVFPVQAERTLEWRDDGLWVIDETGAHFFEPAGDFPTDTWLPRVAALSPDGEWVAFVRHTGGGFEDEGQSCYVARWNGEDESLLLESDWTIPAIYWLKTDETMYVVCQKQSGGTLYHSHFAVIDLNARQIITQVEGMINGLSYGGTFYQPRDGFLSILPQGLMYEVLGENEEPVDWGIFYIDELVRFSSPDWLSAVDGGEVSESPLTDGLISTAWLVESGNLPVITMDIIEPYHIGGLRIYSGWQWHAPPGADELPWEGKNLFGQYDRPAVICVQFDDGTVEEYSLENRRGFQYIGFGYGRRTSTISIQVMSVYSGTADHRCAISEIIPFQKFIRY